MRERSRARLSGMSRLRVSGMLAGAFAMASCVGEPPSAPLYAAEDCRRVELIDARTGEAIVGAEDLELDPARGRLFISAHDRRAVARAVAKNAHAVPEGGVYAVSLRALLDADTAKATPLVGRGEIGGGIRPHGIAYDPATDEIAFINRAYQRIDNRWRVTPRVERIGANGEVFIGGAREGHCHANNLHVDAGRIYVTFDHGECGWRAALEDAFFLKRSGVADVDGVPLYDTALHANGIVRTPVGDIVLAATREKSLIVMDESATALTRVREIALPGGPDNITISEDGKIVAAVHPSLLRIGIDVRLGFWPAPSRVVKVDADTGEMDVLFDDRTGRVFAAATAAVEWGAALVIGSVSDSGLLVCRRPG
jgi:hypothetical protein